jgi:hypothetical protein
MHMTAPEDMPATYWIGGGTGAGKSTVARALAVRHGLRRFAIDSFWYAYAADAPRKSPDEQWLETPPEEQAHEFEAVSRRMHVRVLEQLGTMPTIVEGPQVQPDLVPAGDRAAFLIPTPAFQRRVLEGRPMPSSDPARALRNRLVKDRLYAERIAALARDHGYPVLEIDGMRDVTDDVDALLAIEREACDLRAARRWENEAAAANIRAWLSSPEAPASYSTFGFACECGGRGCDAYVALTLDEFAATPQVVAHKGGPAAAPRAR